jgi:hypothetical protein
MKRAFFIILFLNIVLNLFSSELVTVAEQSDYKRTSTYQEVMEFLFAAQTRSDKIEISRLTTSSEGRLVPLVVISSDGIKSPKELILSGKPAVLIMANIHAGEIEGKEAALMLTRDFVENKDSHHLENQVVLVIPIFNPDGNDKFGKNRRDNGPELAGTRYNGQFLDLNRDYLKLESPEVIGLVKLFNQWDPVLVVDLHTTNGSYHRHPVTYSTNVNPNGDISLADYMWKRFFPGTARILKDTYGYDSLPYGNFTDRVQPGKGWSNDAFLARYGNNYTGLRNRFTVLDENYSYDDFKTRVLASYGFIKSILQYTHQHIREMEKMVKASDIDTKNNYARENFILEFKEEKLFDVTVKSYEFKIEKIKEEDRREYPPWFGDYITQKTDVFKDYTVPYYGKAVPTRSITLPEAYILLPYQDTVIKNLQHHGILAAKIKKPFQAEVEVFSIEEVKPAQRLYQGHILMGLKGHYVPETLTIPKNSYLISMKQPLARLIPLLLEPESEDSLAAWGFFNRQLVSQWTDTPLLYPVYRLHKAITSIEKYQE